jgi:hypothetical protein
MTAIEKKEIFDLINTALHCNHKWIVVETDSHWGFCCTNCNRQFRIDYHDANLPPSERKESLKTHFQILCGDLK